MMLLIATVFSGLAQSVNDINNKVNLLSRTETAIYNYKHGGGFYNWSNGALDHFDSTIAYVLLDIPILKVKDKRVIVIGSTDVSRSTPKELPDGRWTIDVEIISMELHSLTKWMWIEESSERNSTGIVIQKYPGHDFPAECSFNVYIEIHTLMPAPFNVLYNIEPVHISSIINAIPPYTSEFASDENMSPISLYTASGKYSQEPIGFITDADHDLPPEPPEPECKCNVTITNPADNLYLNDKKILPTICPIIIGSVTINALVSGSCNITKVNFYIDGIYMSTDSSLPYSWKWIQTSTFKQHIIRAVAYHNGNICGWADLIVLKTP